MKGQTIGIVLIVIGIVMMVYTGFNYVTTKKVADIGPVQIEHKEDHPVQWSPYVGTALLVGGIVIVLSGKKTSD